MMIEQRHPEEQGLNTPERETGEAMRPIEYTLEGEGAHRKIKGEKH